MFFEALFGFLGFLTFDAFFFFCGIEALGFILTGYEPVSSLSESICVDFDLQGGNSVTPNINKNKTKTLFGYLLYPMEGDTWE